MNFKSSLQESKTFPSDVLKWMKANAAPKMSIKLMQLCKYFQHQKFPYFVVKDVCCYEETIYCTTLNGIRLKWDNIEDVPQNLWINHSFSRLRFFKVNLISKIVLKIAFSDINKLTIAAEDFSFDNFKLLASEGNVTELRLKRLTVFDKFGGTVPIEDILACVPKIEEICFEVITSSFTSKEAAKMCILPNLRYFKLNLHQRDFNIEAFIEFMKINKTGEFIFHCNVPFNNFLFTKQLQVFVDEIIGAADLRYPPPKISFIHQSENSKTALKELEKAFYEN